MKPDPSAWLVDAIAARLRKLPGPVLRALCLTDLLLCVMPFWAIFAYRRWTGLYVHAGTFRERYAQGCRFLMKHIVNTGGGTGPLAMNWFSEPVRRAPTRERADHATPGSCGTCRNCCTTHWLPPEEREKCVFLFEKGCRIYAGVWWDYFNCGRYPAQPHHTAIYECGRFDPTPAPLPSPGPTTPQPRPARAPAAAPAA